MSYRKSNITASDVEAMALHNCHDPNDAHETADCLKTMGDYKAFGIYRGDVMLAAVGAFVGDGVNPTPSFVLFTPHIRKRDLFFIARMCRNLLREAGWKKFFHLSFANWPNIEKILALFNFIPTGDILEIDGKKYSLFVSEFS